MPRPVCVACQCFYRVVKNGVRIIEGKPTHADAKLGLAEPDAWVPYKVWLADMYQCPSCGHRIISGFAKSPSWEDYYGPLLEDDYYKVNDC